MRRPARGFLLVIGATLAIAASFSGCGSSVQGDATKTDVNGKPPLRVAWIADIGGLNDRSFNAAAYEGMKRIHKELGVETRVLTSSSTTDFVPNLAAAARQRYDLIIATGFQMAPALAKVAKKFPKQKFGIIDIPQVLIADGKLPNVEGLPFKESNAGYLVGYLAGLYIKNKGLKPSISAIGALEVPPIQNAIAGYTQGAQAADPRIKVQVNYSYDFVEQAKCREIALRQIEHGSQIVFPFAGQCGIGALQAAKDKRKQAIGADSDQAYLGKHILSSAIKRADTAVYLLTKSVIDGTYTGKKDIVLDPTNDGVGLGTMSDTAKQFATQLKVVEKKLAKGEIVVKTEGS